MDEAKIPTRADISDSDKWDLTHLFADVGKWQEDFAWLQRTYPKLQDWKGRVGESAQSLAEVLEFDERSDGTGTIRFGPSMNWFSGNNFGIWQPTFDQALQFIRIENARRVYELIQRQTDS